jgi:hypothetical protein
MIAHVAATTHILNFSVTTIILEAYNQSIIRNITNVNHTACITIPGSATSYIIDIAQITVHSITAYTGARNGAVFFLNIIINATINQTIARMK